MIKIMISDLFTITKNEAFVEYVKGINEDIRLLMVPSTPSETVKCSHYAEATKQCFVEKGISISKCDIVFSKNDVMNMDDYNFIYLMGGDPFTQNKFLSEIGLKEKLNSFEGVVCGMSAGALNMCETTVVTPDDDIEKLHIMEGIGLVPFSVDVHFSVHNRKQTHALDRLDFDVYCIPNDGAIILDNEFKTFGSVQSFFELRN